MQGLAALSLEYRPLARRPAPVAADDGDGDDMDDLDDQEDYDLDDSESRTGLPVLSNLMVCSAGTASTLGGHDILGTYASFC